MKKIALLLLCSAFIAAVQAKDVTKNLTLTKGVMTTINPVSDLGLKVTTDNGYSQITQNGGSDHYNDLYVIIGDELGLSIVPVKKTGKNSNCKYYVFQITPQIVGSYILKESVYAHYGNSGTSHTITYNITVVDVVSINIPASLSLNLGDTYTYSPIINHPNATTTLTWTSSNTSVATVDENGNMSTVGVGNTTISCIAHNGVSAQCEVTVNPVMASGISLNQTESEMTVGEELQLTATISPENATGKTVTWTSSNENVAFVNESGLVTAVASGTCLITATANDGSGKKATCKVTVLKNNKLTVNDMSLSKGGRGTLHVQLTDEEVISGFQFDLALPEGVTVASDNSGTLMAKLGERAASHSITASKVSDGLYRFVVVSLSGKAITQGEGDVLTVSLDASSDMATGQYDMAIQNIKLTIKDGIEYREEYPKGNTAKLTITDIVPGDVNGDNAVSVTDVISIIGYILEDEPAKFIFPAADMNSDNNITVTDAISVIDLILSKE